MDVFTDPKRDVPSVRKTKVNVENDFIVKREGPHGWWKVHRERGQVPEQLSGWYTKPELAESAIKQYVS